LDNYVAPNGNQYIDRDYPALEDAVSPQSKNKRKKREVVNEKQKKNKKRQPHLTNTTRSETTHQLPGSSKTNEQ
jgi:hypothetical protein